MWSSYMNCDRPLLMVTSWVHSAGQQRLANAQYLAWTVCTLRYMAEWMQMSNSSDISTLVCCIGMNIELYTLLINALIYIWAVGSFFFHLTDLLFNVLLTVENKTLEACRCLQCELLNFICHCLIRTKVYIVMKWIMHQCIKCTS